MRNVLLGVVVLLVAACSDQREPVEPTVDVAAGRDIAEASCADCHGMDGRGQKEGTPNLAAQPAAYLVDALSAYRDGRRHHEPLQEMTVGMSDADIANIAGYYSSLPPLQVIAGSPPGQAPGSSYEEGQDVAAICMDCHGANGDSNEPGIPSLAGQQPGYLILSTQEYVSGSRGHAEKEAMLKGLKEVDIERMAMYFAAQAPTARVAPPFGDPQRGGPLSAACGDCHGAQGISEDPLIPNLAGQEPTYLVNAIKSYRDRQRQHEDMVVESSDGEIEDIAAYYSVQQTAADDNSQATTRELVAKCDRCHGPVTGKSRVVVPSLNGQNREYLVGVMKAYRDNDRGSSMMHKMSANYSDETIEALASHYANRAAE